MDTVTKFYENQTEEINFGKGTGTGEYVTNQKLFSQTVLFDGIGQGKNRPTDYDAVLELSNKYWFAFEIKGEGKDIPYGQSLSYTRTADRWNRCGDVGIVFVVEHSEKNSNKPIMLKDCKLKKYYTNNTWQDAKEKITVTELIKRLKEHYNINNI